jgi:hypothetical protein
MYQIVAVEDQLLWFEHMTRWTKAGSCTTRISMKAVRIRTAKSSNVSPPFDGYGIFGYGSLLISNERQFKDRFGVVYDFQSCLGLFVKQLAHHDSIFRHDLIKSALDGCQSSFASK